MLRVRAWPSIGNLGGESAWDRPAYREIEMKIGEGLRERYKPLQEIPHQMLTLLMQVSSEGEGNTLRPRIRIAGRVALER